MHVAELAVGIYGANGIVAAGAPFAAGAAWAGRQDGTDVVAATFFGEGGANQGVLHETMNLAALWGLPVIFVCENNGYAVTLPQERSTAGSLVERAAAYGMAAVGVDGMDVAAVRRRCDRGRRPGARGGRARLPRMPHLSLLRPPHRRAHDEARLPDRRGDRPLA